MGLQVKTSSVLLLRSGLPIILWVWKHGLNIVEQVILNFILALIIFPIVA